MAARKKSVVEGVLPESLFSNTDVEWRQSRISPITPVRTVLQKLAKFFWCQTRGFGNSAHGDGVDWIVPGNNETYFSVTHYDVPALALDRET